MDGTHNEAESQLVELFQMVVATELASECCDVLQPNIVVAADAGQQFSIAVDLHERCCLRLAGRTPIAS